MAELSFNIEAILGLNSKDRDGPVVLVFPDVQQPSGPPTHICTYMMTLEKGKQNEKVEDFPVSKQNVNVNVCGKRHVWPKNL